MDDSLLAFVTPTKWRELLAREKKRRGVSDNRLVFLGARNLAQVPWCPMQAVRRSRIDELSPFQTYLNDRLEFSLFTGRISSLPARGDDWLRLASIDPPLATVERLRLPEQWRRIHYVGSYWETYAGRRSWVEPDMPRMSWHSSLAGYVIVGEPDGLTRTEVVEAKSSRNQYLADHQRLVGELQADIYGVLFERKLKVMCVTVGPGDFRLDRSPVRYDAVAECLRIFREIDGGWVPAPPKDIWKCRKCEVREGCPIRRA